MPELLDEEEEEEVELEAPNDPYECLWWPPFCSSSLSLSEVAPPSLAVEVMLMGERLPELGLKRSEAREVLEEAEDEEGWKA